MAKSEAPTFERSLARLEEIVEALESPEVSLDETLKLFQEGKGLSDFCQSRLEEAETRVTQLLESEDGSTSEEPFDTGSTAGETASDD